MGDDDRPKEDGFDNLSRLDREVLRSYARGGDASPLGSKAWERSKQYHDEVKEQDRVRRKMLVKGYFSLAVIVIMGGLIIWRVYLWASTLL